jgi:hypothetical protein
MLPATEPVDLGGRTRDARVGGTLAMAAPEVEPAMQPCRHGRSFVDQWRIDGAIDETDPPRPPG